MKIHSVLICGWLILFSRNSLSGRCDVGLLLTVFGRLSGILAMKSSQIPGSKNCGCWIVKLLRHRRRNLIFTGKHSDCTGHGIHEYCISLFLTLKESSVLILLVQFSFEWAFKAKSILTK